MGLRNGIITAPVGVDDVRKALGVGLTEVGALCKSSKVNRWSLWKPIKSRGMHLTGGTTQPDDSLKGTLETQSVTFSGESSKTAYWVTLYGLKFLVFLNNTTLAKHFIQSADEWETADGGNVESNFTNFWEKNFAYVKPTGGLSSPYRLTDFRGYDHNVRCRWWSDIAESPFGADGWNSTEINVGNSSQSKVSMTIGCDGTGGGGHGIHIFRLLESLGTVYFEIATYNNNSIRQTATSDAITSAESMLLVNSIDVEKSLYEQINETTTQDAWLIGYIKVELNNDVKSLFTGATVVNNKSCIYIPLSQHGGAGGELNTASSVFGNTYWIKKMTLCDKPVGDMQLVGMQWAISPTKENWTIVPPGSVGFIPEDQSNNLSLLFEAPTRKNSYVVSKSDFKIGFDYINESDNSRGTWIIDGSDVSSGFTNRLKVFPDVNGTSIISRTSTTVTVPAGDGHEHIDIVVALPTLWDRYINSQVLSRGYYTIWHMIVHHSNNGGSIWYPMSSMNMNFRIKV